jgi:hypothetical protein
MLEVGRGVERSRCLEARSQPNHLSLTMPTEHFVQAQRYKRSFKKSFAFERKASFKRKEHGQQHGNGLVLII